MQNFPQKQVNSRVLFCFVLFLFCFWESRELRYVDQCATVSKRLHSDVVVVVAATILLYWLYWLLSSSRLVSLFFFGFLLSASQSISWMRLLLLVPKPTSYLAAFSTMLPQPVAAACCGLAHCLCECVCVCSLIKINKANTTDQNQWKSAGADSQDGWQNKKKTGKLFGQFGASVCGLCLPRNIGCDCDLMPHNMQLASHKYTYIYKSLYGI